MGAAAHTLGSASGLDSVLVLAQEAVEEADNLALNVDGFHSGSISSLFDTPGEMSWLPASIAGHLGSCVGILAPSTETVGVLSPSRSTVLLLHLKGSPIISLPFGTPLFIEVLIALLHCSFYVDRSVV